MKILHLCNKVPFPGRDGSSLAMESLIRLEQKAGHHIHVLALNTDKHFVSNPVCSFPNVHFEYLPVRVSPSLWGLVRHLLHPSSYFAARFDHPEVRERVFQLAPWADRIVVDSLFMLVYRDSFGPTPWILRAHNMEHLIWERTLQSATLSPKKLFTRWQTARLKKWEMQALHGAKVWAISLEDAAFCHSAGAAHTRVIPCTFEIEGPWTYSGATNRGMYHLGALDWWPNIQGMRWYVEHVAPRVDHPLTVISKQWPTSLPKSVNLNHMQGLEGGFSFEAHGIFIAPILSGSGMRIKLLEAMARGKAIVTTSIGVEGLENAPGISIANSPEAFAQAIKKLIADEAFRHECGERAMKHARSTFADEVFIEELRNL